MPRQGGGWQPPPGAYRRHPRRRRTAAPGRQLSAPPPPRRPPHPGRDLATATRRLPGSPAAPTPGGFGGYPVSGTRWQPQQQSVVSGTWPVGGTGSALRPRQPHRGDHRRGRARESRCGATGSVSASLVRLRLLSSSSSGAPRADGGQHGARHPDGRLQHRRTDRLTAGSAVGSLVLIVLQITFIGGILDFLWPLWDRQNQTLHDKAASSPGDSYSRRDRLGRYRYTDEPASSMACSTTQAARSRTRSIGVSTSPVAAATRASPSPAVWAGSRARAKPSWPDCASRRHAVLSTIGVGDDDADRRRLDRSGTGSTADRALRSGGAASARALEGPRWR